MTHQTYLDTRESLERSITYYQEFGKGWEGNPDRAEALEALNTKIAELSAELLNLNVSYYGTGALYR